MSPTKKLTLSALVAALCTLCLGLGSLAPSMALPAAGLAGIFPAVIVIACGYGWALGTSAVAAALALLLLPDKTSAVWFACFFGHYPLWKALIEAWQTRMGKPALGWGLKLLGFALCGAVLYGALRTFFVAALPFDLSSLGLLLACLVLTAAFLVYDVAFSILIGWFRINLLPKLR